MKFNLKQISNLVDGRLITNMGDIYEMLGVYSGEDLMTHHLPTVMRYLRENKPQWFIDAETILDKITEQQHDNGEDGYNTEEESNDSFDIYVKYVDNEIINYMDKPCSEITMDIVECDDTIALMQYVVSNSLLFK